MWKKNGGISSWLVDNSSTSTVVPDKYNFSGAPNIVFVLVDDWVRINLYKFNSLYACNNSHFLLNFRRDGMTWDTDQLI